MENFNNKNRISAPSTTTVKSKGRARSAMGGTHLVDWRGGDQHHSRFRVDSADVRHHLSQVCLVLFEGH